MLLKRNLTEMHQTTSVRLFASLILLEARMLCFRSVGQQMHHELIRKVLDLVTVFDSEHHVERETFLKQLGALNY